MNPLSQVLNDVYSCIFTWSLNKFWKIMFPESGDKYYVEEYYSQFIGNFFWFWRRLDSHHQQRFLDAVKAESEGSL